MTAKHVIKEETKAPTFLRITRHVSCVAKLTPYILYGFTRLINPCPTADICDARSRIKALERLLLLFRKRTRWIQIGLGYGSTM